MTKNIILCLAFASFLATVSCKDERDTYAFSYDNNNMIVGQTEAQYTNAPKKYIKPEDFSKIEFIDGAEYNFDTITQGDKVDHTFKFRNVGRNDLKIAEAQASCGCTVPEWTKTPIKSGDSGELKIIFNSDGKIGDQNKTVTLRTNTFAASEVITFKVFIKPKPNQKTPIKSI